MCCKMQHRDTTFLFFLGLLVLGGEGRGDPLVTSFLILIEYEKAGLAISKYIQLCDITREVSNPGSIRVSNRRFRK